MPVARHGTQLIWAPSALGVNPLPLHFAQMNFDSFLPWQFVQRSLPAPWQTLHEATARIDFTSVVRWSRASVPLSLTVSSAPIGRSNPRFRDWTSRRRAYDHTYSTAGVSIERYSLTNAMTARSNSPFASHVSRSRTAWPSG